MGIERPRAFEGRALAVERIGAAIDVGSNSVHLLVAALGTDGLRPIHDVSALLGLGPVVDRTAGIPAAERRAAVEALADYVARARTMGAARTTLLATEPLRRASDAAAFRAAVEGVTGLPLHVLTAEEEGLLTLLGVLRGDRPEEPTLVLDVGGGSTELILQAVEGAPVVSVVATGSSRLMAAVGVSDPPTPGEIAALRVEARRLVGPRAVGRAARGIVVGGSGTNLWRVAAEGAPPGRADAESALSRARLEAVFTLLGTLPAAVLAERFGLRDPRARQMSAGAALVEAVMDAYDLDRMEVSDASLREGAIVAADRAGDDWRAALGSLLADGPGPRRPQPPASQASRGSRPRSTR